MTFAIYNCVKQILEEVKRQRAGRYMVIREDNWRLTLGFGQGALVRVVQGLSEVLQRKQKHGHTTTFI